MATLYSIDAPKFPPLTGVLNHTPGAIKAAELITGGKYGENKVYYTSYGQKSVEGIADLIDNETKAPNLLNALGAISHGPRCDNPECVCNGGDQADCPTGTALHALTSKGIQS